ncbi:hypothetical protein CCYA_CCYA07G2006 [Cyanidiococcus yangmingshanensis]|nr:hypothetical protein CCYA_CCYA07G2006 [Cyanidiococcus yangmingshanensis]
MRHPRGRHDQERSLRLIGRQVRLLLRLAPLERRWRAADEAALASAVSLAEAFRCREAARCLGKQHWVFAVLEDERKRQRQEASSAGGAYDRLLRRTAERIEETLFESAKHLDQLEDVVKEADALVLELNEQLVSCSDAVQHASVAALLVRLAWNESTFWGCTSDFEVLVRQMALETVRRRQLWELLRRSCYGCHVPLQWWQLASVRPFTDPCNIEGRGDCDDAPDSEWRTIMLEPQQVLHCWAYSDEEVEGSARDCWRPRYGYLTPFAWQEWIDKLQLLHVALDELHSQMLMTQTETRSSHQ